MVEGGRFYTFQIRSKCWFSPPVRLMVEVKGSLPAVVVEEETAGKWELKRKKERSKVQR